MIYVGVDIAKADHCLGAIDAQGVVVQTYTPGVLRKFISPSP
jgi:hypothetical protein